MTIIPSIDDLQAHGFWTVPMMNALGDFGTARTILELELGKLPQWYRDRLEALAETASPVPARITWLTDIQRRVPKHAGDEWNPAAASSATAEFATAA